MQIVQDASAELQIGESVVHRKLAMFPLLGKQAGGGEPAYLTLDEALGAAWAEVAGRAGVLREAPPICSCWRVQADDVDQFGDNRHRIFVIYCQFDRREFGIDRFKYDPDVPPPARVRCLFAPVALYRETLAGFRIGSVPQLNEHRPSLARAGNGACE